jgi:hypothetical protein
VVGCNDAQDWRVSLDALLVVVSIVVFGLEIAGLEGRKVDVHPFERLVFLLDVHQRSNLKLAY